MLHGFRSGARVAAALSVLTGGAMVAIAVAGVPSAGASPAPTSVTLDATPGASPSACTPPTAECGLQQVLGVALGGAYSGDAVTIDLAPGAYRLASEVLDVSPLASLTLHGAGSPVTTISDSAGALDITGGSVTVSDATLIGAPGTAAIDNGGTLSATDDVFSEDAASCGGTEILNSGGLLAADDTFSSGRCAVSSIENSGSLEASDDTFANDGTGSAIANTSGTVAVANSTISADSAASGASLANHGGTVSLAATVVANRGAGDACSGPFVDEGYNVASDSSCGFGPSDGVVSTMGPLADNGGPTETMALLAGSPALGLVESTALCSATDQRGGVRPPTGCDSGAFQTVIGTTTIVLPPLAAVAGQTLSVTVDVASDGPGLGVPTGTVSITDGSGAPATCPLDPSGTATCSITAPQVGTVTLDAAYGGDDNFLSSVSHGASLVVTSPGAAVTTSTEVPQVSVDFTGSLVASYGGAPTSGAVSLTTDAEGMPALVGTVTMSGATGGTATITVSIEEIRGLYVGYLSVDDPGAGVTTGAVIAMDSLATNSQGQVSGSGYGNDDGQAYSVTFSL